MSQGDLRELRIEAIHANPHQPRAKLHEETIASVREAIANNGGKYPAEMAIVVRAAGAGFEILSGHHRAEGARQAGAQTVWAWVREMDDREAALYLAASNSQKSMSMIEHGRHLTYLQEQHGVSGLAYARMMGKGNSWACRCLTAFRLVERHGGIDGPYAKIPGLALAQIAQAFSDADKQRELLDHYLRSNASSVGFAEVIAAVKRGESVERAYRRDKVSTQVSSEAASDARGNDRPDLAGLAIWGEWLNANLAGLTRMLDVREEEMQRRGLDPTDPRQAKRLADAVESRLDRELEREPRSTIGRGAA